MAISLLRYSFGSKDIRHISLNKYPFFVTVKLRLKIAKVQAMEEVFSAKTVNYDGSRKIFIFFGQ